MFLLQRPSQQSIDRFVHASLELPLSYAPLGIAKEDTPGGELDEIVATIGYGEVDFQRARAALMEWKQFEMGWVETHPRLAPVAVGTVVAVLIRHLGFWSLNGARVIYTVGDSDPSRHFGFAYGTLPNHAEAGEEVFEVLRDPRTDDVPYRIRAKSWPNTTLAQIGQPIVRVLQARFRRHSCAAMERATGNGHTHR